MILSRFEDCGSEASKTRMASEETPGRSTSCGKTDLEGITRERDVTG
jgi:hypothetical protein